MKSPDPKLVASICALLDRGLSESERQQLEQRLAEDPEARQLYFELLDQEVELCCLPTPAATTTPLVPAQSHSRWPLLLKMAAVFALVAGLSALLLSQWPKVSTTPPTRAANPGPNPAPVSAATWSENFEQGIPPGWTGRATNFTSGTENRVAIASVEHRYEGTDPFQLVHLPENWTRGLFEVSDRLVLHLVYRFDRRAHLNVFMHAFPANAPARVSMFQLKTGNFPAYAAGWQQASIPFQEFVRKIPTPQGMSFQGSPPQAGERVATLVFSNPDQVPFQIDRIWISENSLPPNPNPPPP